MVQRTKRESGKIGWTEAFSYLLMWLICVVAFCVVVIALNERFALPEHSVIEAIALRCVAILYTIPLFAATKNFAFVPERLIGVKYLVWLSLLVRGLFIALNILLLVSIHGRF